MYYLNGCSRPAWRRRLALAGCLLVMGSPPVCAREEPEGEVISLTFAWPMETRATVISEQTMIRASESGTTERLIETSYRMRVEEIPEGIRIVRDQARVIRVETDPPEEAGPFGLGAGAYGGQVPNLIVTRDGEFVEAEGVEQIAGALRMMLGPTLDSLQATGAQLPEFLLQALNADILEYQIADNWYAMTGGWAGAEPEVGAVYVMEGEQASPMRPDVLVPHVTEFSASRWVPCGSIEDAEDTERAGPCVLIESVTRQDPEALTRLLTETMRSALAGIPELDASSLEITDLFHEGTIRVICDPDTLLPYWYEYVKDTSWRQTLGGESSLMRRFDGTVLTFKYDSGEQ